MIFPIYGINREANSVKVLRAGNLLRIEQISKKEQAKRTQFFLDAYMQLVHGWSSNLIKELLLFLTETLMKVPIILYEAQKTRNSIRIGYI